MPLFTSFVFQIHVNSLMFIMKKLCQFFNFIGGFSLLDQETTIKRLHTERLPSFCNTCVRGPIVGSINSICSFDH